MKLQEAIKRLKIILWQLYSVNPDRIVHHAYFTTSPDTGSPDRLLVGLFDWDTDILMNGQPSSTHDHWSSIYEDLKEKEIVWSHGLPHINRTVGGI